MIRIPEGSAPDFKNKSWSAAAEVEIPPKGANGVLATIGGNFGGWGLFLLNGKPQFVYALSNQPAHKFRVASPQALGPGNHTVRVDFKYDGGGIGKGGTAVLQVDGKPVAEKKIPQTLMVRFSLDETFDVGEDTGSPVVEDFASQMPFTFTGTLKKFVVVLEPQNLSEADKQRLLEELARASMATH